MGKQVEAFGARTCLTVLERGSGDSRGIVRSVVGVVVHGHIMSRIVHTNVCVLKRRELLTAKNAGAVVD